jgi:hypothetical protein
MSFQDFAFLFSQLREFEQPRVARTELDPIEP